MFLCRLVSSSLLSLLFGCNLVIAVENALAPDQPVESALDSSNRLMRQASLFEEQIVQLESSFGPYDARLVEPLQGLIEVLQEAGEYEEVERLLNRQLQLLHIKDGPETLAQTPVVVGLINSDLRRRDWQSVADRFDHIHWLHRQNTGIDTETLLDTPNDVRAWHLASLYLDIPDNRNHHIARSRDIQSQILSYAVTRYGRGSPELIPWLYSFAVERYHVTAFLEAQGALLSGSRSTLAQATTIDVVERIQRIVETHGTPEEKAMAMLYVADFQMLRRERANASIGSRVAPTSRGNASRTYRRAMDMLRAAGVAQHRIDAFFARPVVLPVSQFHLSLEDAIAQQDAEGYNLTPTEGRKLHHSQVHLGNVVAANSAMPFAQFSTMPTLLSNLNADLYNVSFELSIDSVGKTRNVEAAQDDPNVLPVRSDARDAIERMQFRPCYVEGKWRKMRGVTMRYYYPPEDGIKSALDL